MNSPWARRIVLLAALLAALGTGGSHDDATAAGQAAAPQGCLHRGDWDDPGHAAEGLPKAPAVKTSSQELSLGATGVRPKAAWAPLCLSLIAALGMPPSATRAGDVCHISAGPRLHLLHCVWRL